MKRIVLSISAIFHLPAKRIAHSRCGSRISPAGAGLAEKTGDFNALPPPPTAASVIGMQKTKLRPIAGTRPRGKTAAEDKLMEEQLRNDAKERAEHLMLVDLGRNDARVGTVAVPAHKLCAMER